MSWMYLPTRSTGWSAPILDCSKRKGMVLGAFAGSGATRFAAERAGRRGLGIELDPAYCDTMEQLAGLKAAIRAEPGNVAVDFHGDPNRRPLVIGIITLI